MKTPYTFSIFRIDILKNGQNSIEYNIYLNHSVMSVSASVMACH